MYIIRNSYDPSSPNTFTESKPCQNCLNMLKKYGIRKIAYSQFDGSFVRKKVNKVETEHLSKVYSLLKQNSIL